jgi:nucleotide-binding universal stress UspA family protein
MTYKTILVHLADVDRSPRLVDAAVSMADRMRAHLIGLTVMPPFVVVPAMDGTGVTVSVDQHRDAYQADIAALKALFIKATAGQSFQSEWREADAGFATAAGAIIEHCRTVDIVIASQQEPAWRYSSMLEEPERIAIESGRPLLLIPNNGKVMVPAKNVTIAWNAKREATRAVFDAMPLLKLAQNVNVVWINPEKEPEVAGDVPAAELCTMLSRQGIKAIASQASAIGADVGHEMLRQARAFGSDLLVMGCYGHSRLREFVLGGASKHIIQHTHVPVLLSH